ncbi:MAG: glycosyltransferase family 9 protein [Chthoniobacteraceae bacterium]
MTTRDPRQRLGYDTRSLRSALVMAAVDALWPWRRHRPFAWGKTCVISSVAGLGDFFIQLPLIAGVVAGNRAAGIATKVALRPAMLELGRRCGWDVMPFDNALAEFFKAPGRMRPGQLLDPLLAARKSAPELWIDLSANAVNALLVKLSGARRLAGRVTRGGGSMVTHALPHTIGENEYLHNRRVAAHVGRELDFSVFEKLTDGRLHGKVVLGLSTACRWRNWPLKNFRAIIEAFPEEQFILLGFRHEIIEGERGALDELIAHPRVESLLDQVSILEMIRLVAGAKAVITNDTSFAHIATAYHRPGAVIFGPTDGGMWFRPEQDRWPDLQSTIVPARALRLFHDTACPWYPCVQWTCKNEAQWCMDLIPAAAVILHLRSIL